WNCDVWNCDVWNCDVWNCDVWNCDVFRGIIEVYQNGYQRSSYTNNANVVCHNSVYVLHTDWYGSVLPFRKLANWCTIQLDLNSES
ncbi:MAG: hypothetical protein QNJ74_19460, partial [Trichodesmium sp. MO_231.B1]|nr:hypothetical protein [Trichodesmium sp. MO_231.B1]